MFLHYLRLALLSLRHHLWLTALMVVALGLGIGAAMTSATVFRAIAAHPAPEKEGRLFNVQLDHWAAGAPFVQPGEPPKQLTYRDAVALWEARAARRQTIMFPGEFAVEAADAARPALVARTRLTSADFFPMFGPPLAYGAGWDDRADQAAARVAVVSHALNERAFGGGDSVGRTLRVGGEDFTVVGVLGPWAPLPRYYDIVGDPLWEPEDLYLPFRFGIERKLRSSVNNDCWPSSAGEYETMLASDCIWINFWVELDDAAGAARYRGFLDDYARAEKARGRFPQPLNNRLRSIEEWLQSQHVVRTDTRAQLLLSFAFLAACLVNTVGLLLARFLSRAREISVHRALGASRAQVFVRYLLEAGVVGVCGAVLGLCLTFGGTAAMRTLDPTLMRAARLDPAMAVITVLLALACALAAGAFPAWRACRMAPAAFLKLD